MTDDDVMDDWLRDAMADDAPQLSPAFDAKVMATVRSRGLTPWGRLVMWAYAIGAIIMLAWVAREVGATPMAVSTLFSALVALGLSSYARAVTLRST